VTLGADVTECLEPSSLVIMRVLFSSSSGAGHFGPMIPFVQALQGRGDDVLVAVPPDRQEQAGALGAEVWLLPDPPEEGVAEVWSRSRLDGRRRWTRRSSPA
jgi:UDP:flavonoid glycosyltransferase YjiC (YdhE family)